MKNKLILFLFFILTVLPSLFDSEEFLFIRFFSLFIILLYFIVNTNKIEINKLSLFISFVYAYSILYFYISSPNKYNIRIHFAEYIGYIFIIWLFSSNKEYIKKINYFLYAIILSGFIQILYSLRQILNHTNRIHGNSHYANFLGFFLFLSMLSSLYLLKKHWYSIKNRIICILFSLLFLVFIFLTGSRNIFVLLPTSTFIIVFFYRKKMSIIITITVLLLLLFIPTKSKYRFFNEKKTNPYGVQRLNIYKQVLKISIKKFPMGVGFNNLQYYTLQYNFPVEGRISRYGSHAKIAHNEYLEWIVNAGILGVLLIIIYLYVFFKLLLIKNKDDNIKFLILVLSIFSIYSLIDNALYLPMNAIIFFLYLSLSIPFAYEKNIRINKWVFYILSFIIISILISDIFSYYMSKNIVKEVRNAYKEKAKAEILKKYSDKLFMLSLIGNTRNCYKAKYEIDKYLYIETKRVDYFMEMYYDNYYLIQYDRKNYKNYINNAKFYLYYKNTMFRKYKDIDNIIKYNYNKAIKLNPYNPFIRYDYSLYLLSINDTTNALNNLYIAIENEPYFIKGYVLINKLKRDSLIKKKLEYYLNNYDYLKKEAKTDYEKRLIDIK